MKNTDVQLVVHVQLFVLQVTERKLCCSALITVCQHKTQGAYDRLYPTPGDDNRQTKVCQLIQLRSSQTEFASRDAVSLLSRYISLFPRPMFRFLMSLNASSVGGTKTQRKDASEGTMDAVEGKWDVSLFF